MISKIKKMFLVFAAAAALAAPAFVAAPAFAEQTPANIQQGLCSGSNFVTDDDQDCTVDEDSAETQFNTVLTTVINVFSIIVGIIAVVMIIVGGLKYITSGGDSSNVSGAKNTIIYALVGLVIVALAQFIVHFVLGQAAPVDDAPPEDGFLSLIKYV